MGEKLGGGASGGARGAGGGDGAACGSRAALDERERAGGDQEYAKGAAGDRRSRRRSEARKRF